MENYDPILKKGLSLEGVLHFPEVEKVLPEFYHQLYQRVSIHIRVSRKDIVIEPRGKNEDLKEMVRQQFLRFEDDIKLSLRELIDNDPVYRLGRIKDHPEQFSVKLSQDEEEQSYAFTLDSKLRSRGTPHKVSFHMSRDGKLQKIIVEEQERRIEIFFESQEYEGKLYIQHIRLKMNKHGQKQFRDLEIEYAQKEDLRYPSRITLTLSDESGKPLNVSGNLNPISMLIQSVEVVPEKP